VLPPYRRLAPAERLAVLRLQVNHRPRNPANPAAIRVPPMFHPHREVKLAEVLGVERTDPNQIASLNGTEVLQQNPSSR
jgi:hypothetical protein